MVITDRMLIGAIAGNPSAFETTGEYRFCRTCHLIFFVSAKQFDPTHQDHDWFAMPALNPDGSDILTRAFRRFIKRWSATRQAELEKFALKKGWDMAMELKYGGGALEDHEAAEWQEILDARLNQLMRQTRKEIDSANQSRAREL